MKCYEIGGCELLTAVETGGVKYPRPVEINRGETDETGWAYYLGVTAMFAMMVVFIVVGMSL